MSREDWAPTERLRFVERQTSEGVEQKSKKTTVARTVRILQQWFAPNVPSFMRGNEGEWRDVSIESENAPTS